MGPTETDPPMVTPIKKGAYIKLLTAALEDWAEQRDISTLQQLDRLMPYDAAAEDASLKMDHNGNCHANKRYAYVE